MKKYKILTWHVHGNYLYYLSQIPHQILLPVDKKKSGDYIGKGSGFPWGKNVIEVPADKIRKEKIDCVLFQRESHYTEEQFDLLSGAQLKAPKIFLEHNPPGQHPSNSRHIVNDANVLMVHVTRYNKLMWDCGVTPVDYIAHGVKVPEDAVYKGSLRSGIVVINHIKERERMMGYDIFKQARERIPLDLAGMKSAEIGGLGEISHKDLPYRMARYRFLFTPMRYTSLALAVCEAMMIGLPIVGLPATEMVSFIENDVNGFLSSDFECLYKKMGQLLDNHAYAKRLSAGAKECARRLFGIDRFVSDWNRVLKNRIEG